MPQRLQLFSSQLSRSNLLTLKVFLEMTKADEAVSWEHTDDLEAASALLIDADSELGNRQLNEWASKGKRQVLLAFSSRSGGFPANVLVVPRPLRSAELIPVLQRAGKQFLNFFQQNQYGVSQSSPGLADEKGAAAVSLPVKTQRVLDILYTHQNKVLKVSDKAGRSVIFEMERRRYYTGNLIQMEVEDLIASPANNVRIQEFDSDEFAREAPSLKPQDLEPPLWTAALAVSNGQLFEGLSLADFYRLNRWPDLKKLGHDPLHLKLTALLRRGGTIEYFTEFTKEPREDVVDFINACCALNYLEIQVKSIEPIKVPEQPQQQTTAKRSLLSRIRSRLGI